MSAHELLGRLDGLGVELVAQDGKLRVSAARGLLDDDLKQAIGAHKAELLDLLQMRGSRAASGSGPVVVPRDGALPLSLFQERLWVMQRLQPRSTAYMIAADWRAPSGVSAARLTEAVQALVVRHEGLRMVFPEEGGVPVARLAAAPAVAQYDLLSLSPDGQQARLDEALAQAAATTLDLSREVAVQFAVFALGSDRAVLLLTAHHIAVDAWSISLMLHELAEDLAGRRPAAPALQFADFAAWQRATQAAGSSADLAWWARTLQGAPQLSAFPADHAGTDMQDEAAGTALTFNWGADLARDLGQLVREEGATLYMALLAACAALLRAHTGQGDILLGSPMGVRERPELEVMIGPFVSLVVVRLDLSDDPSFAELLRRARRALLDAHARRDVPFETLVEHLKPARSLQHSPLFQVAVVQHHTAPPAGTRVVGGGALHELTWFVAERDGELAGGLEYRSDLYDPRTIERIAQQLHRLLEAAVRDRHAPVSRLPLLDESERERLLVDFNCTQRDLDALPFAQQFERQAAATPQRVAVAFQGQTLDYAGLNRRANQLARHLRSLGVAPGVLVGVCLERSPDLLVALLAVLKAGGAYVPLDPGFPAGRLAYMLEDSEAAVLLASASAAEGLEQPPGLKVVDLASDAATLSLLDSGDLPPLAGAADPAYVIYTSGSTGRPKGVAVPQGALANFLGAMREAPGLAADDVVAAVTTISFDIAGLELYLPLTVGARIELVPREVAADGLALAECLAASGATVLQATPATWRLLLEVDWRPVRALRAFCGGEPLPRELADGLLPRVAALWNLYGPTETTIWSTAERVAPAPAPITIGSPIANTQCYVLSAHGEPVPVGVAGELWIGGDGVALGYHRRPELTAERFAPDHFSGRPGTRLYRTGDLARWGDDGRLYHLGRLDHQVKVRGFRIELGEIEAELAGHPAVKQALVLAKEAAPGDVRLVAYVVYQPGESLTVSEIRRYLRRKLPDYMVPALVVELASVPLTPNGKVDRAALPDPLERAGAVASEYTPPAPGPEQILAEIWRDILGIERVGAEDNFFELGGHSLLSLRVAAAVEKKTAWRMDPRTLFFQNLRQIAAAIPSGPRDGSLQNR